MKNAKNYWENRAKNYQTDIRGVLFKKPYPFFVNTLFHNWSYKQVKKVVLRNKRQKVLDIACGWGRISSVLLSDFKDIRLFGIDLSISYVSMYNKALYPRGKAFAANMLKMPFKAKDFDVAFLVVSLMYLRNKRLQSLAIDEVFRVLKPDGTFVLIEPTPLVRFLEVSSYTKKVVEKRGFTSNDINALIKNKGEVVELGFWPHKLIPFYISYIIKKNE